MAEQGAGGDWQLAAAGVTGRAAWRMPHPRATLLEIEQEVDVRLAGLRARLHVRARSSPMMNRLIRHGSILGHYRVVWHLIEHDLHHGGEASLTLGLHGLAAPNL